MLRTAERVDRVFDRGAFRAERLFVFIPHADDVGDGERQDEAGGERFDFPLFLTDSDEERVTFAVLIFAAQALDGSFFVVHFPFRGEWVDVDGDLVVEERETRKPEDDAGIRPTRPAFDSEDRVIAAIEVEPDFLEADTIGIPTVFLNGESRVKLTWKIEIETIRE